MHPKTHWYHGITHSVKGKVLLGFLVASAVIGLSWMLNRIAFRDIASTVQEMSAPNQRLIIVNRLIEQVNHLDQLQRIQVLRKPAQTRNFLVETRLIRHSLDTLYTLSISDDLMRNRIDSMRAILSRRDSVYIAFRKLRNDQLNNRFLSRRIKGVSGMLKANAGLRDSSIVTTERKTVTTMSPSFHEKESFFKKLFSRRKNQDSRNNETVKEEFNIRIDTLTFSRQDSIVSAIEDAMQRIVQEQSFRNNSMLHRELRLVTDGNVLINRLWSLLHRIQEEELRALHERTDLVLGSMDKSITRSGIIVVMFFCFIALFLYFILADIAKSNTYRRQLQLAKEEAEHLSAVKQRFLSNMSHEIRTPLQSILGFSEQVSRQPEPDQKMVSAIFSSATHLLQIVNEVLDYSRITSGKFRLESRAFDLNQVISDISTHMELQARQKGLKFTMISSFDREAYFTGDSFRLKQILYNLLGNAVKFTKEGHVDFSADRYDTPGMIRFRISDTGTGISSQDLERIFNEFEQTDNSITRKFGGTGLGLSIARSLTEAMQGRMEVDSEPGKGTTFTLFIPLVPAEAPEKNTASAGHQAVTYPANVLLVDDDAFILELCRTIFTKHNISHRLYASAEELLGDNSNTDADIVFADIRLPGISGIELSSIFRKRAVKATKFIALTAQVLPDERAHLLESGFDAILLKPFLEHELTGFITMAAGKNSYTEPAPSGNADFPDLSMLEKMSMHDEALIRKHISRFIDDTRSDLGLLEASIRKNDREAFAETAHRMAGRTAQIGARHLAEKFRETEISLRENPLIFKDVSEAFPLITSETLSLIEMLAERINGKPAIS